jgi:hypothetical protein
MPATWLADVLRAAGLTVVEHPGWKTRAVAGPWAPTFGVVHATAAPTSQSDATQIRLVRDGHSTLDGPISNACIDHDGRWHVLSAGRCNSTLDGTGGPFKGRGNSQALSVEACNDNRTEPWPPAQYDAYARGWAAWCRRLGWPASNLVGHKEHCPGRKSDPTFDMNRFRADVTRYISGGSPAPEGDDMLRIVQQLGTQNFWVSNGVWRTVLPAKDVELYRDFVLKRWFPGNPTDTAVVDRPDLFGTVTTTIPGSGLTPAEVAEIAEKEAREEIAGTTLVPPTT